MDVYEKVDEASGFAVRSVLAVMDVFDDVNTVAALQLRTESYLVSLRNKFNEIIELRGRCEICLQNSECQEAFLVARESPVDLFGVVAHSFHVAVVIWLDRALSCIAQQVRFPCDKEGHPHGSFADFINWQDVGRIRPFVPGWYVLPGWDDEMIGGVGKNPDVPDRQAVEWLFASLVHEYFRTRFFLNVAVGQRRQVEFRYGPVPPDGGATKKELGSILGDHGSRPDRRISHMESSKLVKVEPVHRKGYRLMFRDEPTYVKALERWENRATT